MKYRDGVEMDTRNQSVNWQLTEHNSRELHEIVYHHFDPLARNDKENFLIYQ